MVLQTVAEFGEFYWKCRHIKRVETRTQWCEKYLCYATRRTGELHPSFEMEAEDENIQSHNGLAVS